MVRGSRALAAFLLAAVATACQPTVPAPLLTLVPEDFVMADSHADPGRLEGALLEIERWHRDHGTGVTLRPGLADDGLRALEAELECRLPDEVRSLWALRDGEPTNGVIWYHRFLPAEEALAEWRSLQGNFFVRWPRSWVPLFEFEGEWYFAICDKEPRKASPVGYFFLEDEPRVAYVSVTAMLETAAATLREGVVTWNPAGTLDGDENAIAAIHARYNPGATFPYALEPR